MPEQDHLILYVDDDRANRLVFEQTFARRFRVQAVASGEEALTLLADVPVAVVVTDQRMPGMSGNQLLEKVRDLWPDVIRIVITAYSDLEPILRAVNDGLVARYIIKPWEAEPLAAMLAWATAAHELGRDGSALQLRLLETERLATLGTIAAAVLHDAMQPVSHLTHNAGRLRELADAATPSIPELPELAGEIESGTRVLSEILTSMTRLLNTAQSGHVMPAEPVAVIRYAISVCRRLTMAAKATVRFDGPDAMPPLRSGAGELSQLLINLIANSAHAIRGAGKRGTIRVAVRDLGDSVELRVDDDGPGMPAEVLAKAGTAFFTTRPGGTGLGLSQCRRLVESVGGRFTIESTAGRGTSVVCVVPKSDQPV